MINQKNKEDLLDEYVKKGGLAGSYFYNEEIDRVKYIKDVSFYNPRVSYKFLYKYL